MKSKSENDNLDVEILKKNPVFVVMTNTDLTQGCGEEYPLAVTKLMSTAKRLGHGKYVQGSDCRICKAFSLTVRINGYSMQLVPGRIILPSEDDIVEDNIEKEKLACIEKKEKALIKARELGLSDDDIAALSS